VSSPHKSPVSTVDVDSPSDETMSISNIVHSDEDYVITGSDLYNENSRKGIPAYVVSRILRERYINVVKLLTFV
jgi:hypothetical protein